MLSPATRVCGSSRCVPTARGRAVGFMLSPGYVASVVVGNRANSDQGEVQASPTSAPSWHVVKTATGKSTDVTFTPTTPGQPQQFRLRIQLKRNNQDYGQLSDIVTVTVNP